MTSITINAMWYDEIKDLVKHNNVYFFTEYGTDKVELDVNEEEFNKVSRELGWME